MKKISLSGSWELKDCLKNKSIPAEVPGSDFGNLIARKEIEDPLLSGKEEYALEIAKSDFEFSRSFTIDDETLRYNSVHFQCDCLDTLCVCYINGKKAFESCNAYIPVDVSVKELLKTGENDIVIHFNSAYNYITEKQNQHALPKNPNGVDGIPYIRKPGCHFGWDWGPCVPYNAILGEINITAFNERISDISIKQKTTAEKSVVTVKASGAKELFIITPDGKKISGSDGVFEINNPELWYTRELSQNEKQPLYTVVMKNDEETVEKKIGLRNIYLDRSPDQYGENFCFVLNGKRIFAKGANLIPFAAIPEQCSRETTDYYLDLAVKSNFNMIRTWGGGSYADEYLLSRCDELGLLVWQDFCFACQLYPLYDKDFTDNVLKEVDYNVRRMELHPSLALWCGNNEIEVMFSYMLKVPKSGEIIKAYTEFFYHTLPDYIKPLTDVSYIPTSPIGVEPFKECTSDKAGDTHMWNVWHGMKKLNYYEKRYTRFLSEFGLESLPSMKAISTFANKKDYDLASDAFMSHQKCVGGNQKMLFYLTEKFDLPKSFEDLPYLTGIVQAECIKSATEHFRNNKGRCNGSIFWQYNDVWNAPSWSSVDFEGVPKALQYWSKHFFEPVGISYRNGVIYVSNDTLYDKELDLKISVLENDKITFKDNIKVFSKAESLTTAKTKKIGRNEIIKIENGDSVLIECDSPTLKRAEFITRTNRNLFIIKSNTFAKYVFIESDAIAEENYFSLFPGEEKIIAFDKPVKNFKIRCVNNIEFENGGVKKSLFRFFYRLKPLNIANAFYYQFN